MIMFIIAGVAVLAAIAVVVGIVDAAHAPTWREIAAERRAQWEAGQSEAGHEPQLHGPADPWRDED